MRLLILALLLLLPLPALAERILEVQNIRIEQTGSAGRDAAVAEATRQAAAQVWKQLGHTDPLPTLSAERLQDIASYVDVANETIQPNFYSANFSVGIRVAALQGREETATIESAPLATGNEAPRWVLVVPGREINEVVSLWVQEDAWSQAWNRASSNSSLSTAVATGDTEDRKLLTAAQIQSFDPALSDSLRDLARKYNAPAVALVLLSSARPDLGAGEEVEIEVTYVEAGGADSITAQSDVRAQIANSASPLAAAITRAQQTIESLATGESELPPASPSGLAQGITPTTPAQTQTEPASFANSYSRPAEAGDAGNKLWVRIPLSTPADLGNYRKKIESIPGARFQITALNRMYVEGNILYSGDQAGLMRELAARGLAQQ
jgi:hypothetical protein